MIYNVNIEETINGDFQVEANSKQEAFEIARKKYYEREFVNEPGNISKVQAAIAENNNDYSEWVDL